MVMLLLIMLFLTSAVGTIGLVWLLPAVLSHIVFWVYLGYAILKTTYVPYSD